jgi:hypothetical protein
VTYEWRRNPEIAKQFGGMPAEDRDAFFKLWEALEDDPRSRWLGAMPYIDPRWPGAWQAPFGEGWRLVYLIVEDVHALEPLHLHRPSA